MPFTVGLAPGVDAAALFERLNVEFYGSIETIAQLNAVQANLYYEPDKYGLGYDKLLDALRADPQVRYAEKEELAYQFPPAAHTLDGSELDIVRLPRVRSGSAPVTVAVIGNGVTPNQELPAERVVAGYDATEIYRRTTDLTGRGTMAAGIIAGDSGICSSCKIMPIRLTLESDTTQSLSDSLARGIVWATDNGAQVITTTAYLHFDTTLIREAVRYATERGVLMVASASTDAHQGRRVFPAGFDDVLAVSAVTTSGQDTMRGNHNTETDRWIDVAAAEGVPAVDHNNESKVLAGVEGSTAVVAGTVALAFASRPGVTAAEVRKAITDTTTTDGVSLPLLNAGTAVYSLTGQDSADPEITSTGLTTDQLITDVMSFRPSAVDDTAVTRMELYVGGDKVATRWNPWQSMNWSPPENFNGRIALTLRAVDVAGRSSSATTTVRVDTAGPAGSIVSPAAGARVRGSVEVVFRGAADVASAEVNGVAMKRAGSDWSATVAPSGGRLVVEATDKDGYRSRFTQTVVVDNDGPAATVNPKQNTRVRGTFTTSLTAVNDASGVAKAELWANGKYLGAGYSKKVATGQSSGNVKLVWKLTDRLGNTRSYTRTVIADNKAPSLSITKAPGDKAKVKGTVQVTVKASDASGIARIELSVNGKVVATDKTAGYVLRVNTDKQKKTMKVRVCAYDKLGNIAYTGTRTWYRR
ncbi:Ig-like domain-containing protein [Actinoplanes teichomyceticus]|uniref:Subtilase family protein n=1 Tax=Actinoplanes teichomyceticus TaxID=1867 RepID=A0A561VH03_ACTTI|nr:Ig-like domain-containing protein [Actinoplanes teichomyceticus]TWG10889.1 subtilase family protein [Actinoplanes teichomyceticus]